MKKNKLFILLYILIPLIVFIVVTYGNLTKTILSNETILILFVIHVVNCLFGYSLINQKIKKSNENSITIGQQIITICSSIIAFVLFLNIFPEQSFVDIITGSVLLLLIFTLGTLAFFEN